MAFYRAGEGEPRETLGGDGFEDRSPDENGFLDVGPVRKDQGSHGIDVSLGLLDVIEDIRRRRAAWTP